MMRRRIGRPGLIGTMARTAVISGTATAVSGGVQRRQYQRAANRQAEQQVQYAAPPQAAPTPQPAAPQPTAAAAAGGAEDRIAQIRELGELKAQGLLTDEEFAAEKARILGA
ncbi:SHOCT domain-containing protein [Nocardioides sambongensis]|uniref:SHOCT domain-containing protein n=1 Tax=Nocardioides sambongensis TaxID=2589074 RepID=UPI0018C885FA|nr:SHOCT domain-containing protein [Nocardioides sambongensis]